MKPALKNTKSWGCPYLARQGYSKGFGARQGVILLQGQHSVPQALVQLEGEIVWHHRGYDPGTLQPIATMGERAQFQYSDENMDFRFRAVQEGGKKYKHIVHCGQGSQPVASYYTILLQRFGTPDDARRRLDARKSRSLIHSLFVFRLPSITLLSLFPPTYLQKQPEGRDLVGLEAFSHHVTRR